MTKETQDWFDPSPFIEGSDKLIEIVGEWPSFDDAEVLNLVLDRTDGSPWKPGSDSPTVDLRVRIAETGYYLVEIQFRNVRNLALTNFRYQNSVQEIIFERVPERVDAHGGHRSEALSAEIVAHCGLEERFEFQSGIVRSVVPCDRDGQPAPINPASSVDSADPVTS